MSKIQEKILKHANNNKNKHMFFMRSNVNAKENTKQITADLLRDGARLYCETSEGKIQYSPLTKAYSKDTKNPFVEIITSINKYEQGQVCPINEVLFLLKVRSAQDILLEEGFEHIATKYSPTKLTEDTAFYIKDGKIIGFLYIEITQENRDLLSISGIPEDQLNIGEHLVFVQEDGQKHSGERPFGYYTKKINNIDEQDPDQKRIKIFEQIITDYDNEIDNVNYIINIGKIYRKFHSKNISKKIGSLFVLFVIATGLTAIVNYGQLPIFAPYAGDVSFVLLIVMSTMTALSVAAMVFVRSENKPGMRLRQKNGQISKLPAENAFVRNNNKPKMQLGQKNAQISKPRAARVFARFKNSKSNTMATKSQRETFIEAVMEMHKFYVESCSESFTKGDKHEKSTRTTFDSEFNRQNAAGLIYTSQQITQDKKENKFVKLTDPTITDEVSGIKTSIMNAQDPNTKPYTQGQLTANSEIMHIIPYMAILATAMQQEKFSEEAKTIDPENVTYWDKGTKEMFGFTYFKITEINKEIICRANSQIKEKHLKVGEYLVFSVENCHKLPIFHKDRNLRYYSVTIDENNSIPEQIIATKDKSDIKKHPITTDNQPTNYNKENNSAPTP